MKKVAIFLVLLMGGLILYSKLSKPTLYTFTLREELPKLNPVKNDELGNTVEDIIKDSEGRYGILVKNLKSNKTYSKLKDETFKPASLYKVWVMGAVFEKIKEGKIGEDEKLVADVLDLNKKFGFSDEEAELKEGVLNFTVKSALEQMITISHNYAAYALIEKVGRGEVENFLKKYGLNNSTMGSTDNLETTASDMGKFFEKLYKGEIVDSDYSKKMIDILLRQKRNDRIPKYLPEEVKVAHKTGELDNIRNDAGIVFSPDGDFIVVILTETKNVTVASEKIAEISKALYEYFNK